MKQNNYVIFQFFHWYFLPEDELWLTCEMEADDLKALGITHVWLPPAYKSAKKDEPGYAVYDLYDLGEFDQKGSIRTKYGTKDQYLQCISALQQRGIKVIADVVLNHKFDGDHQENVSVIEVSEKNREKYVSEMHTIKASTGFGFPGRADKYSEFHWSWHHFTGLCHDGKPKLIVNEFTIDGWGNDTSKEKGNFDFLMANDIEFRNPAVRKELMRWGTWYTATTGVDGFRLDGLKHISADFYPQWLDHLEVWDNKAYFVVGEYWDTDIKQLVNYIRSTGMRIRLFDVPLHVNLYKASTKPDFDLRNIFKGTLTESLPDSSVTFVDNHDTQPLQSLKSYVEDWFQPLAHALILLRSGGTPCIFYPAVYGASYSGKDQEGNKQDVELKPIEIVPLMLKWRHEYATGAQEDYFDDKHMIGWVRSGLTTEVFGGCAVVISTKQSGTLKMSMGLRFAGQHFVDITGNRPDELTLDENGDGDFWANERSVSVWVCSGRKNN